MGEAVRNEWYYLIWEILMLRIPQFTYSMHNLWDFLNTPLVDMGEFIQGIQMGAGDASVVGEDFLDWFGDTVEFVLDTLGGWLGDYTLADFVLGNLVLVAVVIAVVRGIRNLARNTIL